MALALVASACAGGAVEETSTTSAPPTSMPTTTTTVVATTATSTTTTSTTTTLPSTTTSIGGCAAYEQQLLNLHNTIEIKLGLGGAQLMLGNAAGATDTHQQMAELHDEGVALVEIAPPQYVEPADLLLQGWATWTQAIESGTQGILTSDPGLLSNMNDLIDEGYENVHLGLERLPANPVDC